MKFWCNLEEIQKINEVEDTTPIAQEEGVGIVEDVPTIECEEEAIGEPVSQAGEPQNTDILEEIPQEQKVEILEENLEEVTTETYENLEEVNETPEEEVNENIAQDEDDEDE